VNPTLKNTPRDPRAELQILIERLRDYERESIDQLRLKLIDRWKAEHPEAAVEQSAPFHALMRHEEVAKRIPEDPDEAWFNDVYYVTVRRGLPDKMFGSREGMITLGIASHDGCARHDWRDFQAIKNQLAGEECEAVELFPAESRLLDPSNYYTLWCFPGVKRLRIGMEIRDVRDRDTAALAPQRAFAKADA
jgi:hypothetical protein